MAMRKMTDEDSLMAAFAGEAGEGEGTDAKTAAAEDAIAAIKKGDASGFAHAFQMMYDICAAKRGETETEDDVY